MTVTGDVINVWHHHLDETGIQNMFKSMSDRCAAVIKAKGGAMKGCNGLP